MLHEMLPLLLLTRFNPMGGICSIICMGVCAAAAIFGCLRCMKCRCRNCPGVKRCLRCTGCDSFDDFEVMILVHESYYDQKVQKFVTSVRISAGAHKVKCDENAEGIYQQPLTVFVEQGTSTLLVELLDRREKVLANLKFDTLKDLLSAKDNKEGAGNITEKVYTMKQKGIGVTNPKMKLSFVFDAENDMENGLLAGMNLSTGTEWAVKQQIKEAGGAQKGQSDLQILAQASAGPLELFEGMGNTRRVFVAVLGPPHQKKFTLNYWVSKSDFDKKHQPEDEIDLLMIKSIQSDPARANVFAVNYFDSNRIAQNWSLRRIDRAREVWVEMLQLVVKKVHEERTAKKNKSEKAKHK